MPPLYSKKKKDDDGPKDDDKAEKRRAAERRKKREAERKRKAEERRKREAERRRREAEKRKREAEAAERRAQAAEKRAEKRADDEPRLVPSGPGKGIRVQGGGGKSEAEKLAEEITGGGGSGGGGSKDPDRQKYGGRGGTARDINQPIGGVGESVGSEGYFNMPGTTEDVAGTFFGPLTYDKQRYVWEQWAKRNPNARLPADGPLGPNPVPARYLEDDDQAVLGELYGTEEFLEVQAALKARHPGRSKYTPGVLDDNTRKWMREAMADANSAGVSWQDILWGEQFAAAGEADSGGSGSGSRGGGGGGGGGGGSVGPVTDPEAIRQMVDQIAQDVIGRRVPDQAVKEQIVAEIHALEQSEDATGITTSVEDQIRRKIRERFGGETVGHDYAAAANVIMSAFTAGPGGGFGTGFGQTITGPQGGAPV